MMRLFWNDFMMVPFFHPWTLFFGFVLMCIWLVLWMWNTHFKYGQC